MNISQPAMSKRLRALEAVAGVSLFERTSRGVTLTHAGAQLYGAARRLLHSADGVQALIQNQLPTAPVRIASSPSIAEHRLPKVLAELAGIQAGLSLEMVIANSLTVRELVRTGRSDLGVAAHDPYDPPNDDLAERVVWRDEIVIAVPAGHPWEELEEIPVKEFAGTAMIEREAASNASRLIVTALGEIGLQRVPPVAALGTTPTMVTVAITSNTPVQLSLLTAMEYANLGLVIRRVAGMRFEREFSLVWVGGLMDLTDNVEAVARYIIDQPFARSRRASREFLDAGQP